MRWSNVIADAARQLDVAGIPSPGVDARELAEAVAGHPLPVDVAGDKQLAEFEGMLERRLDRQPLQLITGHMYFRYLDLPATPGVFITRPETEWMTQDAVDVARRLPAGSIVLDACTGSGAIALSIATEVPHLRVIGVDISPVAIDAAHRAIQATERAQARQIPIDMRIGDVLSSSSSVLDDIEGKVQLLVANPPYIPELDRGKNMQPELAWDPPAALWGGSEDGLAFPRALIGRARTLLAPKGMLIMEHDERQAMDLRRAASEAGFSSVSTGDDLAGRPRWLRAQWDGDR